MVSVASFASLHHVLTACERPPLRCIGRSLSKQLGHGVTVSRLHGLTDDDVRAEGLQVEQAL